MAEKKKNSIVRAEYGELRMREREREGERERERASTNYPLLGRYIRSG